MGIDGLKAIRDAAERLREDQDMRRKLLTFVDYWGLDAYTPPDDVEANVRDLVLAFLYVSRASEPTDGE